MPAEWSPTGYAALYIAEMPEVRFDEVGRVRVMDSLSKVVIDRRFVSVCEPGTIELVGLVGDEAVPLGGWVKDGILYVRASRLPWRRPREVRYRLSGIRKGFLGARFEPRTREQFEQNEKFINSAYGGETI